MTLICGFDACVQIERARKASNFTPNTDVSNSALWSMVGRFSCTTCGSRISFSPVSTIEPNVSMVDTGLKEILEPQVVQEKRPTIDHNAEFDTSVFGVKFDAFLARSIWTHASKPQIRVMLDNFLRDGSETAFFLASYLRARWPWQDYKGEEYRGKSHKSTVGDLVMHSFSWIEAECRRRGLFVRELPDGVLLNQKWLKISRLPLERPLYRI